MQREVQLELQSVLADLQFKLNYQIVKQKFLNEAAGSSELVVKKQHTEISEQPIKFEEEKYPNMKNSQTTAEKKNQELTMRQRMCRKISGRPIIKFCEKHEDGIKKHNMMIFQGS